MPCGDYSITYDAWYGKFLRQVNYGPNYAWSDAQQKWILWLHESQNSVLFTLLDLQQIAREYQYKIGDKVLYCGLSNDADSSIYTVTGFDDQGKVVVSDDEGVHGGFYMSCWRLATLAEQNIDQRILVDISH